MGDLGRVTALAMPGEIQDFGLLFAGSQTHEGADRFENSRERANSIHRRTPTAVRRVAVLWFSL
jgi:hypothetical protein